MTTSGILASVARGAMAMAVGVIPTPRMCTFSLTISSWASRLPMSATVVSSLRIISIFLPATTSPCCCVYRRTPAKTCLPTGASPPVIECTRPTLTTSCAQASGGAPSSTEIAVAVTRNHLSIGFLPSRGLCDFWGNVVGRFGGGMVLVQHLEERLCLLELRRVNSLGEPAVDRREEVTGFGALALLAPQARKAGGGTQLPKLV